MKYVNPEVSCVATGKRGVDYHHIYSRKSGGPDEDWNLIPINHLIHVEWHLKGTSYMVDKYTGIRAWMKKHGWYFEPVMLKWRHD